MQLLSGIENVIFAGNDEKAGIFSQENQNLMFTPEPTEYRQKNNNVDNLKESMINLNKVNIQVDI